MDTSKIEFLLEKLIEKQDEIISRIEKLESTLINEFDSTGAELINITHNTEHINEINEELNWWGDSPSFAKQLLSALDRIESATYK